MELLDESIVPEHAREIKAEARAFADEHIVPNAEEHFRTGEYPWAILEAGQDAGLVAQDIDEDLGGRGLGLEAMLAIAEEFYRADAGIALTLRLASFGAEMLAEYGSEEQKEQYPPGRGERADNGARGLGTGDRLGPRRGCPLPPRGTATST